MDLLQAYAKPSKCSLTYGLVEMWTAFSLNDYLTIQHTSHRHSNETFNGVYFHVKHKNYQSITRLNEYHIYANLLNVRDKTLTEYSLKFPLS